MTYNEWYDRMCECDPDYVVDVLGLTSKELLDAFPRRAEEFYEEEQE